MMAECKRCRGSGQVGCHMPFSAGGGWVHILEECPECKGKGFKKAQSLRRAKPKKGGKE